MGRRVNHIWLISRRSKDILSRWTFPLVPDDNHPGGHLYEHLRGNKYIVKDNSVCLSRYVPARTICLAPASPSPIISHPGVH